MSSFLNSLIIFFFTVGTTIFYSLSCVERRTLPLVFGPKSRRVPEEDIRFTHEALKRLTPLLPPSFGVVILGGTISLVVQAVNLSWNWQSITILSYYWVVMLYIIFIGNIGGTVKLVRSTNSWDDSIGSVEKGVKKLIVGHHQGLMANLGVVILQIVLMNL